MKVYKTQPEQSLYRSITVENFEADTGKRAPFYQQDGNKEFHFAVCPACNNPIQILGLYQKTGVSEGPFAKHYPKSINNLAVYSQESYEYCPYAAPRRLDRQSRRKTPSISELGQQILEQLCNEYDRVIYILEQDSGLVISDKMARIMLEVYLTGRGYDYRGASLMNVPWILGYMSNAHSLVYRWIKTDTKLHQELLKLPDVKLQPINKNTVKIEPAQGYVSLSLCFIHHVFLGDGRESMKMLVTKADVPDAVTSDARDQICLTTIDFNHGRYQKLISAPVESAYRPRQELNHLASELIKPILGTAN